MNRRRFLGWGGGVLALGLAGCLSSLPGRGESTSVNRDEIPHSVSKAGPSTFDASDDELTGWVHVVANGETYLVTYNA